MHFCASHALVLFVTVQLFVLSQCYLPVVMMHGINGGASDFNEIARRIKQTHPNTLTLQLKIVEGLGSVFSDLQSQLKSLAAEIDRLKRLHNFSKHHLLCHSQGALLCRAYVQTYSSHTVKNLISLAGPQMGVFGVTEFVEKFLPGPLKNVTRDMLYLAFYTNIFQRGISFTNYWRDPEHYDNYQRGCSFLPALMNETQSSGAHKFRANFERLANAVFTGSNGDEVIQPWGSCVFDFYKVNQRPASSIVPMKQQPVYKENVFGLKTLDQQNRLHIYRIPGYKHLDWLSSELLFKQTVEPFLD